VDILQNVVLPAKQMSYQNVRGVEVKVNVMDVREVCAEKIRAMSDRARYRDFYDFYLLTQQYKIDLTDTIGLVKQKEIRKPISPESILQNWAIASEDRRDEIDLINYQNEAFNNPLWIEDVLRKLQFEKIVPGDE
jgi:predicted nucleotidyltransferase component of viral defense system